MLLLLKRKAPARTGTGASLVALSARARHWRTTLAQAFQAERPAGVNGLGLCGRACAIERGGLEPSNRCRIAVVVAEARLLQA
jgi:hypothetical protein